MNVGNRLIKHILSLKFTAMFIAYGSETNNVRNRLNGQTSRLKTVRRYL